MGSEHKIPQVGQIGTVALVGQAFGVPVTQTNRVESAGTNIVPAGLYSMAPYKDPHAPKSVRGVKLASIEVIADGPEEFVPEDRLGRCIDNDDTCQGWATKMYHPYCNAHGRARAGLSAWAPKKDE